MYCMCLGQGSISHTTYAQTNKDDGLKYQKPDLHEYVTISNLSEHTSCTYNCSFPFRNRYFTTCFMPYKLTIRIAGVRVLWSLILAEDLYACIRFMRDSYEMKA